MPSRPEGATHFPEGFFDHANVSFVGRPFPLAEADGHFDRLRSWGIRFLRFLVTWEAVEHTGPGIYDEEYLDYLAAVVKKTEEYGFLVEIDPHQDVWSRFSGGDGAPGWTFETAGLDIRGFAATGAAVTHQCHGDPLPHMIWATNSGKLAAATMFTLFFGGNDFAPKTCVRGSPVQNFLQEHFVAAMARLAERLKGFDHVLGYGAFNEPSPGYIGWKDLASLPAEPRIGDTLSALQSMAAGSGIPQTVDVFRFGALGSRRVGKRLLDPGGTRAWLPDRACIWRDHGVWGLGPGGLPVIARADHFNLVNGAAVDFGRDYFRPFVNRYAAAIRSADPRALIFLEPAPNMPVVRRCEGDARDLVCAPHWYDGPVIMLRGYSPFFGADSFTARPVFGPRAIRRSYRRQIGRLIGYCAKAQPGSPVLIGECGIPFNLRRTVGWRGGTGAVAARALNRTLLAMDDALASYAIWNYTPCNTHDRGDGWNGEDFSIFCADDVTDAKNPDSGGRALEAAVRPYARATAGRLIKMEWNMRARVFTLVFRHSPSIAGPTEIFIPSLHYPSGAVFVASDGRFEFDEKSRTLRYFHSMQRPLHRVAVRPA